MTSSYDRPHLESIVCIEQEFLSTIIKGHHAVDKLFDEALYACLPRSDRIDVERIAFLLKADLLISLGVIGDYLRPSFSALNMVRNKFAHDPYTILTLEFINNVRNLVKQSVEYIQFYEVDSFTLGEPKNVIEYIIAVSYIHTAHAIDAFKKRQVESCVLGEMAKEAVAGVGQTREYQGLSLDEELRLRVLRLLESDTKSSKTRK